MAAGRGTRIKSTSRNKVTLSFLNKPLILYAVELLHDFAKPVVVVLGAFSESVKEVLREHDVVYAFQKDQLGTAHATEMGVAALREMTPLPSHVLVAYGDHTMFYQKETVKKLIGMHIAERAAVSFISTLHEQPDKLAWGRIIRNNRGEVVDSIEQKDATDEQKKIKELNTCFYCFDFDFLEKNISKVEQSPVSGEYYLTDMIKIAARQKKTIKALRVPFENVGIGVNKSEELEESQKIYLTRKENS